MLDLIFHPALVHLPLGMAFLMPFFAAATWFIILKKWVSPNFWLVLILLQTALFGFGLISTQTGEREEEIVEKVVAEKFIEEHEEKAELFTKVSGLLILLLALGLWKTSPYIHFIRGLSLVAVTINLVLAIWVGHSGGNLVYKHGAAEAYTHPTKTNPPTPETP